MSHSLNQASAVPDGPSSCRPIHLPAQAQFNRTGLNCLAESVHDNLPVMPSLLPVICPANNLFVLIIVFTCSEIAMT
jgi:hypothetical protein